MRLRTPVTFLRRTRPATGGIVSYVRNTYPNDVTGVACYDHILRTVLPGTRSFTQRAAMRKYCKEHPDVIVITDNHMCLDVPLETKCIIVHHGIAKLHGDREPDWARRNASLIQGQRRMLQKRSPANTRIVSCSTFCSRHFEAIYGQLYTQFQRHVVPHMSALELYGQSPERAVRDGLPVICGDWRLPHKGSKIIQQVKAMLDEEFEFRQMKVQPPKPFDPAAFAQAKMDFYSQCDLMLCLSLHEGNSYFVLDGMYCNLPLVTTDVGLADDLVKGRDATILQWKRAFRDAGYVAAAVRDTWKKPMSSRVLYDQKWSMEHYTRAMNSVIATL
jgi:hypothetical protein